MINKKKVIQLRFKKIMIDEINNLLTDLPYNTIKNKKGNSFDKA